MPEAVMTTKQDKSEQYCELVWNTYKRNEIQVTWNIKNPRSSTWPTRVSLAPLVFFPDTRMKLESSVCRLHGFESGKLRLKI